MRKLPEVIRMEDLFEYGFDTDHDFSLNHRTNYGFIRSVCIKGLGEEVLQYVSSLNDSFVNFVQLGIGGSALGATAALEFLNGIFLNEKSQRRYFVLDNIDPERLSHVFKLDLSRTLFHVVSKSGSTMETVSQFFIVFERLRKLFGDDAYSHLVFTTSRKGFLYEFAQEHAIKCFFIPDEVGGRFSVFTSVGLLPIAFFDHDIGAFIEGAKYAIRAFRNGWRMPLEFASFTMGEYLSGKNILVMFAYKDRLYSVADWFRQLWAESLGKSGKGQTPVKALGVTDQHSQLQLYQDGPKDKVIVFLDAPATEDLVINEALQFNYLERKSLAHIMDVEKRSTMKALRNSGVPCGYIQIKENGEFALGALFASLMIATAKAAEVLGVNAFDQPAVELGKRYARETLKEE